MTLGQDAPVLALLTLEVSVVVRLICGLVRLRIRLRLRLLLVLCFWLLGFERQLLLNCRFYMK